MKRDKQPISNSPYSSDHSMRALDIGKENPIKSFVGKLKELVSKDEIDIDSDVDLTIKAPKDSKSEKRAQRVAFRATVEITHGDQKIKADSVNISETGMYLEAEDLNCRVGEKVDLFVHTQGVGKEFATKAEAVRITASGYGFQFLN